jgi:hypothetical protein
MGSADIAHLLVSLSVEALALLAWSLGDAELRAG